MKKKDRATQIIKQLKKSYPKAQCGLIFQSPFQLLQATILSAQCTDSKVNKVTPVLFRKYPTATEMAKAKQKEIEKIIYSIGLYKNKTKNLIECAKKIVGLYDNQVPQTLDDLTSLPGVGRKTANVVLGNAFLKAEGIVVDTHVKRISNLTKLSDHKDPKKIEIDLMKIFDKENWIELSHLFIFHGRNICIARNPKCGECIIYDFCPGRKN